MWRHVPFLGKNIVSRRRQQKEKFVTKRTTNRIELVAKTDRQAEYIQAIKYHPQVISVGCAGTGKTYIAASIAADLLRRKEIDKIVLTRPNVSAGKSLGFFKGTMEEKLEPWVAPFTEVLKLHMGANAFEIARKNGDIEIVPLEVMRGRSFNNSFVVLDEAQNTTVAEIKMFLTRIGEDTTVIINGDIAQCDLKEHSGLSKIIHMAKKYAMPIPVIEFTEDDIVRSDICAMWIKSFNREGV